MCLCFFLKSQALGKGEMMEMKGKGSLSSVVDFLFFSWWAGANKNGNVARDNGPMGVHIWQQDFIRKDVELICKTNVEAATAAINSLARIEFHCTTARILSTRYHRFRGLKRRQWGNMLEWRHEPIIGTYSNCKSGSCWLIDAVLKGWQKYENGCPGQES